MKSTLDIQRSRVVFCIAVELRRRHVVLIKHVSTSTGTGYRRYRITYHTIFCSKVKLFIYILSIESSTLQCVYTGFRYLHVPQIVVNSQLSALSSHRHLSNSQQIKYNSKGFENGHPVPVAPGEAGCAEDEVHVDAEARDEWHERTFELPRRRRNVGSGDEDVQTYVVNSKQEMEQELHWR